MPHKENITYEIDPHNRLIARKTNKASGVTGYREVLDGKFSIGEGNSLSYHVKKSGNSDIPQQIKISGNYSLDAGHNLIFTLNKWNNQVEGDKLIIKSELLDAKDNELAFSVGTRDSEGKSSIYILKLSGVWKADKQNRLSFEATKEKGPKDKLTLRGSWAINDNHEIAYTYTTPKTAGILTFKGHWYITKNQRITYILNKKIKSGFDFSGRWRLSERFGLFFEAPFKGKKPQNISFGADCRLGRDNTVEFKLKNNLNKDIGAGLKLSRNILKNQGEAFIGALREGKKLSLTAGIGFRWCLFIIILFSACAACAKDVEVGVTFSQVQCEYFDLNWKDTYKKTLDVGFDIVRLGAYWNRIEKNKGEFDFSELDWQIKMAKNKKVKVLLTVGMKAPRWPEFFVPQWAAEKVKLRRNCNVTSVSGNKFLRENTLEFLRKVVMRYRHEEIISAWQVENEPFSRSGPSGWWIGEDFVKEEIGLVRSLDRKKRPIVVNAMTYPNKFLRFLIWASYKKDPVNETINIADIPALNVYYAIGHKLLNTKVCFWADSKERKDYIGGIIKKAKAQSKPVWITEAQAEPWEPGELVHTREENAVTCGTESFPFVFQELSSLGCDAVFLWGVEYWFFRFNKHNDIVWLKTVLNMINK